MSKYEPLGRYLRGLKQDSWHASFAEIEDILGAPLPASARRYSAWWANNKQGSRHTGTWLDIGWRTDDLNLTGERVMFRRLSKGAPSATVGVARSQSGAKTDSGYAFKCEWDRISNNELRLGWEWLPLGSVSLDASGRLRFPIAFSDPAIYRFRIRKGDKESRYVGETDNLARRFGNYRNPGPSQQTSLRISAILKQSLADGAEISASQLRPGAWLERKGNRRAADLSSKSVRCLFENAVICAEHAEEIETLNRAAL